MKIKKLLFKFVVLMIVMLFVPLGVNAKESKYYNIEAKNLEDYILEELKEHNLFLAMQAYNKLVVYDETNDKHYLIDFSNNGVCEEYTGEEFEDVYYEPTEYRWDGNNLYLDTYSSGFKFVHAKTLDKEIEPNSSYAELEQDGFYHVSNPVPENLSNYYEVYFFKLATETYDKDISYYEIKKHDYTIDEHNFSYEIATTVELDENTYEPNVYYVIAQPVKTELIGQFDSDKFIVPKDKSGLDSDFTLTRFDFQHHIEFGNKTYYVFANFNQQNLYCAIFDESGNYKTFGLDNLSIININITQDNKYLTLLAKIDNKNHLIILDQKLNIIVLEDVSNYGDDISLIGNNQNVFYYLSHGSEVEILEINYFGNTDKYKVTFNANGGKFGNENIYTIDEWDNSMYDNLKEPTREGFTFKGYYTEETGGTKFEMILNESGIDSDMTFYAQWEENPSIVPPQIEDETQPDNNENNTDTENIITENTSTESTNTETGTNSNTTVNNPSTGDNIMLFVVVLGISIIGITTTTIISKKNSITC